MVLLIYNHHNYLILVLQLFTAGNNTEEELTWVPQLEVVDKVNTVRVDYTMKAFKELICIT